MSLRHELEHFAARAERRVDAVRENVKLTIGVFAERPNERLDASVWKLFQSKRLDGPTHAGSAASGNGCHQQRAVWNGHAAGPVGKNVFACEGRDGLAAIHVAAGDGDSERIRFRAATAQCLVGKHRTHERLAIHRDRHGVRWGAKGTLRIESIETLAQPPAVIAPTDDDIDLLTSILAYIGEN